jgi:uncharacterized membrane protein YpjA
VSAKAISDRTLSIVSLLSGLSFFILLMFPYYYILGRQAYIPKTNPDFGYFLPKSPEAWLFLTASLSFLGVSLTALVFFLRRNKLKRQDMLRPEQCVAKTQKK